MANINDLTLKKKKELLAAKEGFASAGGNKELEAKYSAQGDAIRREAGIQSGSQGIMSADQLRSIIQAEENALLNNAQQPVQPIQAVSPTAEQLQAQYLEAQRRALESAHQANVAGITSAEQSAIAEQQSLIAGAGQTYEQQKELAELQGYQNIQAQKVSGRQRGIASSQQQLGLEQGILNKQSQQIADADASRIARIQSINDRIATIKAQAEQSRLQSAANMEAGIASAQGDLALQQLQRQYQSEDRLAEQQFVIDQTIREFEQQKEMQELDYQQRVNLAELDREFTREMAELSHDQKMSLAQFDRETQGLLMQADQDFRMKFLKAETSQQMAIIGAQAHQKAKFFELQSKQQEKMMQLEHENKMEIMDYDRDIQNQFFLMDTVRQKNFLDQEQSFRRDMAKLDVDNQLLLMGRGAQLESLQFQQEIAVAEMIENGVFNTYQTPDDLYNTLKGGDQVEEIFNLLGRQYGEDQENMPGWMKNAYTNTLWLTNKKQLIEGLKSEIYNEAQSLFDIRDQLEEAGFKY